MSPADCACVLVAGGLGERLGYSGIKVALPTEITTGTTYLGLYCKEILALQASSNALAGTSNVVPLAIMTSDDTHQRTVDLLAANDNFGMAEGQVRRHTHYAGFGYLVVPCTVVACVEWSLLTHSPHALPPPPHPLPPLSRSFS